MSRNLTTLSRYALGQFLGSNAQANRRFVQPIDILAETTELSSISDESASIRTHDIEGIHFKIGEFQYFCLIGHKNDDDSNAFSDLINDFVSVELCGAIHLFILHHLKLKPVEVMSDLIEQMVIGPAESEDGVELTAVLSFYPKLYFFQFQNSGFFDPNISANTLHRYLASFHPHIVNRCILGNQSITVIRELLLEEKAWLHKDNIFHALTSSHMRHAFLEVYRCLEFAFVLPRAKELMQGILASGGSVTEDPIDFAKRCTDTLGWRRIERDSIFSIFKELVSLDHTTFFEKISACAVTRPSTVPNANDDKLDNVVSSIAQSYYSVRNQVAHQFWPQQMREMKDSDWDALIILTAYCVKNYH